MKLYTHLEWPEVFLAVEWQIFGTSFFLRCGNITTLKIKQIHKL